MFIVGSDWQRIRTCEGVGLATAAALFVSFVAFIVYIAQKSIIKVFAGQHKAFFGYLAGVPVILSFPLFVCFGSSAYVVSLSFAVMAGLIYRCHDWWLSSERKRHETAAKLARLNEPIAAEEVEEVGVARYELVRDFPWERDKTLPTKLGNAISAFENHPFQVYNIDPSTGWYRLMAITPEGYRKQMADAEASFLAVLNLTAVSYVVSAEFLAVSILWGDARWLVAGAVACVVGWVAYRYSCDLAKTSGEYFRSAFDLYRLDLLRQVGVRTQDVMTPQQERNLWAEVQDIALFRQPNDHLEFRLNRDGPPRRDDSKP